MVPILALALFPTAGMIPGAGLMFTASGLCSAGVLGGASGAGFMTLASGLYSAGALGAAGIMNAAGGMSTTGMITAAKVMAASILLTPISTPNNKEPDECMAHGNGWTMKGCRQSSPFPEFPLEDAYAELSFDDLVHGIQSIDWESLPEDIMKKMPDKQSARKAFTYIKAELGGLVDGSQSFEWDKLPESIKEYVKENPGKAALQVALIIPAIFPGVIFVPVSSLAGFSVIGPVAGSAAAAFQSAYGTPMAFRVIQGAAMGGKSLSIVNNIISGGAVGANGLVSIAKRDNKKKNHCIDDGRVCVWEQKVMFQLTCPV